MNFIKISNDRYMIENSNNVIVSEKEKLQLEKKELVLNDISSNNCQKETTKKIKKINKKLSEIDESNNIEEAEQTS